MTAHKWPEQPTSDAKVAAIRQLSLAYEHFAEVEQVAVGENRHEDATVAHGYCVILLRAMVAEDVNPAPKGLDGHA